MVFLTEVTGILKPFAFILGEILNGIYNFCALIGVENLALCIILFTFVVKMLMLPLTIKQQKFTKLSSKMNPELQKIQEKYKGRKDEDSMRRQQAETQAVYKKYGASPMSGCLPLLISLPILFALYKVIYAIPAYVTDIGNLYRTVADSIIGLGDAYGGVSQIEDANGVLQFISDGNGIKAIGDFIQSNNIVIANTLTNTQISSPEHAKGLIDILAKFNPTNWNDFFALPEFAALKDGLTTTVDKIISVNNMFGLSILDTPVWNGISVIIPILAFVTQFLQGKLQSSKNPNAKPGDTAATTSKTMMTIMPIMSGVFCLMLPIGVGIYWIASAVFTIVQTIFINKYLDKTDIDAMIEKNKAKAEKRQEKMGITHDNKMAGVARTQSKNNFDNSTADYDNTSYKKNRNGGSNRAGSDYRRSNVSYSAKSISANANLLMNNSSKKANRPENKAESAPVLPAPSDDNADTDSKLKVKE